MDFSKTRLSWRRPILSYYKVQSAVSVLVRNRRWAIRRSAIAGLELLDVGCGFNLHDGFVRLDYHWNPGVHICWDITRGVPLPSGSIRGIFTEHALEHLPFDVMPGILAEFRRVLRRDGVLRIVVPDGELYLKRYAAREPLPYAADDPRFGIYSPIMSVNRIFRSHGHLFMYDFDTLTQLLQQAGFVGITREAYGKGGVSALLVDDPQRAVESVYVEARAP